MAIEMTSPWLMPPVGDAPVRLSASSACRAVPEMTDRATPDRWRDFLVDQFSALLVDFDPQGALSVGLGLNPNSMDLTVYDLLLGCHLYPHTDLDDRGREAVALLEDGEWTRGSLYIALSLGLSLFATFLGFAAARELGVIRGRV